MSYAASYVPLLGYVMLTLVEIVANRGSDACRPFGLRMFPLVVQLE